MNAKNIYRLRIILCLFWILYPLWLGGIIHTAWWCGMYLMGFLATDGGRTMAFVIDAALFVLNVVFVFVPANTFEVTNGANQSKLVNLLDHLHIHKQREREEIEEKRAREIEEAVKLAKEMQR